MGGQIIDASIVPVPRQRNKKDENEQIKAGKTPGDWADKPAKARQKDTDARWTKKNGKSHYGYKNHINVDRCHKLVRRYDVTSASVHDSQVVEDILDDDNTASGVWADSAYRSAEIEAKLAQKGLKSRIHRKAKRGKPLGGSMRSVAIRAAPGFVRGLNTSSDPSTTTWGARWSGALAWPARRRVLG